MEVVILTATLLLAVILVIAAGGKLVDRQSFRKSLADFGVSARWISLLSWLVPTAELLSAALLLLPLTAWFGAIAALVLLLTFSGAIAYNLILGRQPKCNCFGQIGSGSISSRTILRNTLLAVLAAMLVMELPAASVPGIARLLLIAALTISTILITFFALLRELFRRQEDLTSQLEDFQEFLESGALAAGGANEVLQKNADLPVGAPAPSFRLRSLRGSEIELKEVLAPGKPLVIFFLSSDCGPCSALVPEIELWRHELSSRFAFSIVSQGSIDSNRAKFAKARLDPSIPILIDSSGEVSVDYRAKWTPAAILVSADGTVGSQIAFGDKQITALLDHLTESRPTPWFLDPLINKNAAGIATPRIGEPSPVVSMSDANGNEVNLAGGLKTMLLFWGADCRFCEEIVEDLRRWEMSRMAGAPQLLVVSRGNSDTNGDLQLEARVVHDRDLRISQAFGTPGTPSAVLIDGHGKVASVIGTGANEVFALAGYKRK